MNPILTIIVPSYNTSKYVDECVPTFIHPSLLGRIVVYFIDDGATDNTKEKLKPYIEKYPSLFYFFHKENGGHGSVINYGVHELTTTKYFRIVDGDDWIHTESLINLVDYLEQCDDDIVITGFFRGLPNHMSKFEPYASKTKVLPKTSFDSKELIHFNVLLYSCTYKTKLFINHSIFVREKVFYEDNELRAYPLEYAKTFSYVKCYPYCYRFGTSGQSISLSSMIAHKNDGDLVMSDLLAFYKRIDFKSPIKLVVESIIASNVNFYVEILSTNQRREMINNCRKKWRIYKKEKYLKRAIFKSSRYKKLLILTNFLAAPLLKKRWSNIIH